MPPRIPDDRRQAILADIQAGKPRNAIAREHGVAASTVSRIAEESGVDEAFDRTKTENATRARQIDTKALRAAISADLLVDAARLRERAWSPYTVPMSIGGKEGGIELVTTELPPLSEVRNAYTSVGIVLDKHLRLEQHDSDTQGLAAVDAWLRDMMGA